MDYVSAFNSAYPQKKCEVEFAFKKNGEEYFHIIIDGDKGHRPLTRGEMREAIRAFMAGK